MRFIPDYRVCYKGRFYEADEEFDIDPADELEMSQHGEILEESESSSEEPEASVEDKPRRGRPPKKEETK